MKVSYLWRRFAFLWLTLFTLNCSYSAIAWSQQTAVQKHSVVGQLLLPYGTGSRGVQVIATVISEDNAIHSEWLDLDEQYRFRGSLTGMLKELEIVTGIDKTVHQIVGQELVRFIKGDEIDIGTIDLRERLLSHKIKLTTGNKANTAALRIGMWFEKPPTGVSLGSRQFPEVSTGTEIEWLLPREFDRVYFLVERPANTRRGRNWRSGKQSLFGPFSSRELPTELKIE